MITKRRNIDCITFITFIFLFFYFKFLSLANIEETAQQRKTF